MLPAADGSAPQRYMRTLFTTAVWGTEYVENFLNYSLCTQLGSGNLAAADPGSLYLLISDVQGLKRIKESRIFAALTKLIDVECVDIASIANSSGSKYSTLTICQNYALVRAYDFDAIFFGYGDALWSDGSYRAALARLKDGYHAVFAFGYPVLEKPFKTYVDQTRPPEPEPAISIDPRDFSRQVYRHLHPMALANNWKNEWMTHCPSYVLWDVPDQGTLIRSFHLHPVAIRVRNDLPEFFIPFRTTLDEEFVAQLYRGSPRVYVCPTSDEITVCSLAESTDNSYEMLPRRRVNFGDLAAFAETYAGLMHRELFRTPIRLVADKFDEEKWIATDKEAAEVLREAQARLSIPDSVLALEHPTIFNARMQRQATYKHWVTNRNEEFPRALYEVRSSAKMAELFSNHGNSSKKIDVKSRELFQQKMNALDFTQHSCGILSAKYDVTSCC